MTIALARPVLTIPRVELLALLSTLRPAPAALATGRYATAPRVTRPGVAAHGAAAHPKGIDARATPHLRITRRGRAVLTLLAAVPLSAGAVMLVSATGASASLASVSDSSFSDAATAGSSLSGPSATTGTRSIAGVADYVQVAAGDSLWSVAEAIAPEADPREVIDDLVQTNGLTSLDVYPGQQLEVPSPY